MIFAAGSPSAIIYPVFLIKVTLRVAFGKTIRLPVRGSLKASYLRKFTFQHLVQCGGYKRWAIARYSKTEILNSP